MIINKAVKILMVIAIIIAAFTYYLLYVDESLILNGQPLKAIAIKRTITLSTHSICDSLVPILKKREGLELKPYIMNGYQYIYYEHLILKGEVFNNTKSQADSILRADIYKSYIEVRRIDSLRLYNRTYTMFISGKYKP